MSETVEPAAPTGAPAEPVAAPAPAPEPAVAAAPAAVEHTAAPSLLEGEAAPTIAPAPAAPVYQFTLPEGFEAPAEQMAQVSAVLGRFNVAPEDAQALVNMHVTEVQRLATETLARQHQAFGEMRKQWATEVKADPEMGGAAFDTTRKAVARARDLFVPESDRAAFNDFLRVTGAGDHPAFWRMLHRAARLYDEPAPPQVQQRPPSNAGQSGRRTFRETMYGSANNRA